MDESRRAVQSLGATLRRRRQARITLPNAAMNSTIPEEELERERVADPQNYRREFLAEWLDDVDQFLPDSDISVAVRTGVREQPFAELLKAH